MITVALLFASQLAFILGSVEDGVTVGLVNGSYVIRNDLYEGDILLTEEQSEYIRAHLENNGKRSRRQAMKIANFPNSKWPVGTAIPYEFTSGISNNARRVIRLALQFWESHTCLSFAENGQGNNGLKFIYDQGCYSLLGRVERQRRQDVSIGKNCDLFGIVTHEVAHALGFYHTHSRHDRGQYVDVYDYVVQESIRPNYNLETSDTNDNYKIDYDYGSVMHYAGDRGDGRIILKAKQPKYQSTMGNRLQPAFNDILMMNTHYGCLGKCTNGPKCQNEGYNNPKSCNKCICPEGFGGDDCSKRADPENGATCGGVLEATSTPQELTNKLDTKSQNRLDRAMVCTWHIKAPAGQVIQIRPVSTYGIYNSGCSLGGTEIKYESYTRTGIRFCKKEDISNIGTVVSSVNPVIIRAYAYEQWIQFALEYTAVSANGAPLPPTNNRPPSGPNKPEPPSQPSGPSKPEPPSVFGPNRPNFKTTCYKLVKNGYRYQKVEVPC